MKYTHQNKGTCSKSVSFDLSETGIVTDISFIGGCNGNLKGISALCEGQPAQDVIQKLIDIRCGFKNTSCPHQLSLALQEALEKAVVKKPLPQAQREFERWLASPVLDDVTKSFLLSIKNNPDAINERFAVPMTFGTAGLRSKMDAGISKMNVYTVAQTTQGLASLILENGSAERGVTICHDSRNNSRLFAVTAARVLAANGIKVYLFDDLRPTPELSFAILMRSCIAGINITASHNPKEYNGYKVYWEDGAQLPPDHADTVSAYVAKTDIFGVLLSDFEKSVESGRIIIIGKETDEAYLSAVLDCRLDKDVTLDYGDSLNIIYTPLHGTGRALVPEALKRSNIHNLRTVTEQMTADGDFPTVASPNPENKECFALAAALANSSELPCDLLLATDPDADRIGVAVREHDGDFVALNGNQIGALLISYIINVRKRTGNLPENACAIKSVVSSKLFDRICERENVAHIEVLTGFKYIGEKIKEWSENKLYSFIFGYEESQGYLTAGYARDKDAVAACVLIAEAASYYKSSGITLYDALQDIYSEYGFYREKLVSINVQGLDPMAEMKKRIAALRNEPMDEIEDTAILRIRDYLSGTITDIRSGSVTQTGLPTSDMLFYELEDDTSIVIRPSGTEPKIKLYVLVSAASQTAADEKVEYYANICKKMIE